MKSILKSLVTANSAKRWENYRRDFKSFFKERDSKFDETIEYLESFIRRYDEIPDWNSIYVSLQEENPELCQYLTEIISDGVRAKSVNILRTKLSLYLAK